MMLTDPEALDALRHGPDGQALRRAHETLRRVFVQVGGCLILAQASFATRIEMGTPLEDAGRHLADIEARLATITAPPRLVRPARSLQRAAALLNTAREAALSPRASGPTPERLLEAAFLRFRATADPELGLWPVDMHGGCCNPTRSD